jgi:hypothetical protein
MAFEPPPEREGSAVHMPDPLVNVLKANLFADADVCNVDPWMVPTDATIGADVAYLEAVRVLKRWKLSRQLPRGGVIAGGGCAHIERLMRTLMVALFADVGALPLLCAKGGARRSGSVGFEGTMPPLVAAVRWRCAGFDALREDAQAHPPRGQLGQPGQGGGGERHAVVGADTLGQAACFAHAREHGCGRCDARRGEGLATAQNAAVTLGAGQRLAVAAVTSLEVACDVGAPHLMGGTHVADGLARMPTRAALALLGHSSVAPEEVTDGLSVPARASGDGVS